MQIRLAQEEDLEEILRLNAQAQELHASAYPEIFKNPADQDALRAHYRASLEGEEHRLVVAEREENLGGYLRFQVLVRPANPFSYSRKHLYVHDLRVDRDCRRQGVARALFDYVEDFGKKALAEDVLLGLLAEECARSGCFPSPWFQAGPRPVSTKHRSQLARAFDAFEMNRVR